MRKPTQPMADFVMGFMHHVCFGILIALILLLLSGCGSSSYEMVAAESVQTESVESTGNETDSMSTSKEAEPTTLFVYICGAVNAPGVYELPLDARVYQAIQMAGGLRADADERYLNQAAFLTDGEQITVYTREETQESAFQALQENTSSGNGSVTKEDSGKVNINTADAEALKTLNGIGDSRAGDIISYREANGAFETIEDIMKVSGIKQAMFDKIKDRITVG